MFSRNGVRSRESDGVVARLHPRSPAAEAFRMIRTNMEFMGLNGSSRVWMVTSPGAAEGKSTVAANLAVTLAAAGRRTLLVDADLRRSRQHHLFGVENVRGLSNVLTGSEDWRRCVQPVPGGSGDVPAGAASGLDLLPSGPLPPNPAELLQAVHWRAFLAEARDAYETVLVDAPPVLLVTDAQLLAPTVDRVLLVVRNGFTRRDALRDAYRVLERSGARHVAAVLNRVAGSGIYPYYPYAYYAQPEQRA